MIRPAGAIQAWFIPALAAKLWKCEKLSEMVGNACNYGGGW
jgi:hypothetical protein